MVYNSSRPEVFQSLALSESLSNWTCDEICSEVRSYYFPTRGYLEFYAWKEDVDGRQLALVRSRETGLLSWAWTLERSYFLD